MGIQSDTTGTSDTSFATCFQYAYYLGAQQPRCYANEWDADGQPNAGCFTWCCDEDDACPAECASGETVAYCHMKEHCTDSRFPFPSTCADNVCYSEYQYASCGSNPGVLDHRTRPTRVVNSNAQFVACRLLGLVLHGRFLPYRHREPLRACSSACSSTFESRLEFIPSNLQKGFPGNDGCDGIDGPRRRNVLRSVSLAPRVVTGLKRRCSFTRVHPPK